MKYEITEDQIKEIALGGGKTKIKEYFPDVFQPKETVEDFLNEIFKNDFICKTDKEKYPNSVFYFQGETFLLEIEKTSEKLYVWVNYDKIWNPISSKFSLSYSEIQQILKVKIEEHFKLSDATPLFRLRA